MPAAVATPGHDAVAYCGWRSEREGKEYRLPAEAEWEKAARGVDGRWYPWGNRFDPSLCNMNQSLRERQALVQVDEFPGDLSLYGVRGTSGNVSDWTATEQVDGEGPVAADQDDGPAAVACFRAACMSIKTTGPFATAMDLLEIVDGLERLDPTDRGRFLLDAGQVLRLAGRSDDARTHFEQALAIWRAIRDRRREGATLGYWSQLDGLPAEEASKACTQALAIAREVGDRRREALWLNSVANRHWRAGRLEEARAGFEHAIPIVRELGDAALEGTFLCNLASVHAIAGRSEDARVQYERALAIAGEVGNRWLECLALGEQGAMYLESGRPEQALPLLERAAGLCRQVGDRPRLCYNLANLGELHLAHGRRHEARTCLTDALAIAREVGITNAEGSALLQLSAVHDLDGSGEQARQALAESERLFRAAGDQVMLALVICQRGARELAAGDSGAARACVEEAEAIRAALAVGPDSELGRKLARLRASLEGPA